MKDIISKLATKHKVSPSLIARQLKMGTKVEHEHTTSDTTARRIATDHLDEVPDYYSKLKKYVESKNYGEVSEARRKDSKQEINRLHARIERNLGRNINDLDPQSDQNLALRNQNERIMGALQAHRMSRSGENPTKSPLMGNEREFGVGFRDTATHLYDRLKKSGKTQFTDQFIKPFRLRGY